MKATIKGALEKKNARILSMFEHNGKRLTKVQAVAVLKYGLSKGYELTTDISDEEIDKVLEEL